MGSYNPLNKNCFEIVLHFGWVLDLDWIQDTGLVTLTGLLLAYYYTPMGRNEERTNDPKKIK